MCELYTAKFTGKTAIIILNHMSYKVNLHKKEEDNYIELRTTMKGSIHMTYMVGVIVHGLSSKVPDTVGNLLSIPGGFPGTNINTWNNEIHVHAYGLWT